MRALRWLIVLDPVAVAPRWLISSAGAFCAVVLGFWIVHGVADKFVEPHGPWAFLWNTLISLIAVGPITLHFLVSLINETYLRSTLGLMISAFMFLTSYFLSLTMLVATNFIDRLTIGPNYRGGVFGSAISDDLTFLMGFATIILTLSLWSALLDRFSWPDRQSSEDQA